MKKDYDTDDMFNKQMSLTSEFLNIEESSVQLLYDLMQGEPTRIFKCNTNTPKINLKGLTTTADFDITRMSKIADLLKVPRP
jgi:hypothetical protein